MKRNKGITLIALVITIIVLLILAGVAISMLSGENGILRKAAEAKTKTEEAQKEEDTSLIDMELTTHFITNNSEYKCRYGFITGFTTGIVDGNLKVTDTVQKLIDALPNGYDVTLKYNTTDEKDEEITNKDENIKTGMAITKNGKEIARTVLLGDVNCDGEFNITDKTYADSYINFESEVKPFQKIAMNTLIDEILDKYDVEKILRNNNCTEKLDQSSNIISDKKLKRYYTKVHEFIEKMPQDYPYILEYNEKEDMYTLKGVTKGTTVGELKQYLPTDDYEISVGKGARKSADGDEVTESHRLWIKLEYVIEDGEVPVYSIVKFPIKLK